MSKPSKIVFYNLAVFVCLTLSCASNSALAQDIKLTYFPITYTTQRIGQLSLSHEPGGRLPQIGARKFAYGINIASNSYITYILDGKYSRFKSWVGVEKNGKGPETAKVKFQVFGDGNKLYDSGTMEAITTAKQLDLDVSHIKELELRVVDAEIGGYPTSKIRSQLLVNWAEPQLTEAVEQLQKPAASKVAYQIKGGNGLSLQFDENGKITGAVSAGNKLALAGSTLLTRCKELRLLSAKKLDAGALSFTRLFEDEKGNQCEVTDTYTPTSNSIRWDIEIYGKGKPWSTTIVSSIYYPVNKDTRFWTAWSNPDLAGPGVSNNDLVKPFWSDPLEVRPMMNSSRWYGGNPSTLVPTSGDLFTIPQACIIDQKTGYAISLVQSPEDKLLYMKLITTGDGTVEFQRRHHRIGGGNKLKFSMDLVSHKGDWKSSLNWTVKRYPDYFEPLAANAQQVGGAAAYSSWEGEIETEKLKKMAFKFNWKASFDFPYMGMFLPPAEKWKTFATSAEAAKNPGADVPYVGATTSRKQLEGYSAWMKKNGFHVLNYFNVTEFGTKVKGPESVDPAVKEEDLWKDGNNFLHRKIADGILYDQTGSMAYYRTWGDAIIMDPAGKNYKQFILDQAQRHIDYLPSSAGICIDRMDWLIYFNVHADDGTTWFEDKPARSLLNSWKGLMDEIGPIFHKQGKSVFVNPILTMRLDLMKNADGIYSEYNEMGPGLNSCVFLGMRKPVAAWTWNEYSLKPDPDYYFQRFLYLGVFPSAPVPDNNHEIKPGEFADYWYLRYGPLFNDIMGKKWVLEPDVYEIIDREAKANLFEVENGYALPVVMARKGMSSVDLSIDLSKLKLSGNYTIDVLLPGSESPVVINTTKLIKGKNIIQIPIQSQCALVRIKNNN
ncbi:NPCBM/NEW2 domain-containing protein [Pedobacter heparinus]|uniref:NPCBM/NEW2 domain-containing protein n=1 Tax=Pedobacter heparinus TaxID=984 RepID=UPI00292DD7F3|nr:NPCBM/NEW2 domain-containing protein [Pedobacter heparinus]